MRNGWNWPTERARRSHSFKHFPAAIPLTAFEGLVSGKTGHGRNLATTPASARNAKRD